MLPRAALEAPWGYPAPVCVSVAATHATVDGAIPNRRRLQMPIATRVCRRDRPCWSRRGLANAAPPKVVTEHRTPIPRNASRPWASNTKLFSIRRKGPYRIALANGYIANTWRIQMIKTAKAYAAQPDVAAKLKEFKVSRPARTSLRKSPPSTTSSTPATTRSSSTRRIRRRFEPVIKRANDAGVVLVAFDKILDTEEASTSTSTRRASASTGPSGCEETSQRRQGCSGFAASPARRSIATRTTASRSVQASGKSGTPSK
jgi:hypothetical protein